MDPDGDGYVDFAEFSVFWTGVEAQVLLREMDDEDLMEALKETKVLKERLEVGAMIQCRCQVPLLSGPACLHRINGGVMLVTIST